MAGLDLNNLLVDLDEQPGEELYLEWKDLHGYTNKRPSVESLSRKQLNHLLDTAGSSVDIVKSIFRYFAAQILHGCVGVGVDGSTKSSTIVHILPRTLPFFAKIFCGEQTQGFSDEKRALFVADGLYIARNEFVSKIEEGGLKPGEHMVRNQLNIGDICVEICDKWFAAAH